MTFNDRKISKSNFYKTKILFEIDNIDADIILISKKEPYGKKEANLNILLLRKIMIIPVLYV